MKKITLGILFGVLFLLTSLASVRVIVRVSQDESKAFENKVGHCVGSALVPTFFLGLTIWAVSKKPDATGSPKNNEDKNQHAN